MRHIFVHIRILISIHILIHILIHTLIHILLRTDQWQWLEDTLETSPAKYNILVSSIQVLTTNPVVESWGHFPTAKKRLLDMLIRINPRGLVLASGDVHHAEVSVINITNTRTNTVIGQITEITSSGMTHSCT